MVTLSGYKSITVPDIGRRRGDAGKEQESDNRRLHLIIYVFMKYLRQGYSLAPSGIVFLSYGVVLSARQTVNQEKL